MDLALHCPPALLLLGPTRIRLPLGIGKILFINIPVKKGLTTRILLVDLQDLLQVQVKLNVNQ